LFALAEHQINRAGAVDSKSILEAIWMTDVGQLLKNQYDILLLFLE
jgi:hypothetical protein